MIVAPISVIAGRQIAENGATILHRAPEHPAIERARWRPAPAAEGR
jgi:hypothetical protein